METIGVIRSLAGGPALSGAVWCKLAERRSELVLSPAKTVVSKFTGASHTIPPSAHRVSIVLDGRKVGEVEWAYKGDYLTVRGDADLVTPLAHTYAAELGGEFVASAH